MIYAHHIGNLPYSVDVPLTGVDWVAIEEWLVLRVGNSAIDWDWFLQELEPPSAVVRVAFSDATKAALFAVHFG